MLPPRIVLNAVEGWGKTTAGAHCPNPAILKAEGETGYDALRAANLVPEVDSAVSSSWTQTLATIDGMIADEKRYDTLVLDALNGYEIQCQAHVCHEQFGDDWGERGFAGYQRGYDMTAREWIKLLARLDQLRAKHSMLILLLSHCKIRPFKNPEGPDFDRYASNVHDKIWDTTKQWTDAVFFGNFLTVVQTEKETAKKGKGIGGSERVLYAERSAAFDAKNRFGMASSVVMPNDPGQVWATIAAAMKGANNGNA